MLLKKVSFQTIFREQRRNKKAEIETLHFGARTQKKTCSGENIRDESPAPLNSRIKQPLVSTGSRSLSRSESGYTFEVGVA